jgi:hypothetical protein
MAATRYLTALSAMHVARMRVLELGDGAEVARLQLGDVCLRFALEGQQVAEPFGRRG